MKISVLIPTFNSSRTVRQAIDSVLEQTIAPDEILVVDDGSSDDTVPILGSYGSRVTVVQQKNAGCAASRNRLFACSGGDMLAFLDHDDVWHPRYLETQKKAYEENPKIGLFFTGHFNFEGYGKFPWEQSPLTEFLTAQYIDPVGFVRRYYDTTGIFGSMSFCCVRRSAVHGCDAELFSVNGADDSYFITLMALLGCHVRYDPTPLVAYRITPGGLSVDRVRLFSRSVQVFEELSERFSGLVSAMLAREFERAFALRRRAYAKLLMGAGRIPDARVELVRSLSTSRDPQSIAKAMVLLFQTFLPRFLQPAWPRGLR